MVKRAFVFATGVAIAILVRHAIEHVKDRQGAVRKDKLYAKAYQIRNRVRRSLRTSKD